MWIVEIPEFVKLLNPRPERTNMKGFPFCFSNFADQLRNK